MRNKKTNNQKGFTRRSCGGFTIVEMAVAIAISAIVVLSLAIALCDSQRGWNSMYNRAYSDVVTGSHVAERVFERVVRKSSKDYFLLDADSQWVEVYYYQDPNSVFFDLYARFIFSNGNLSVEYGKISPRETLSVDVLCDNVAAGVFKQTGRSLQMMMTIDDGKQNLAAVTSAVMHN